MHRPSLPLRLAAVFFAANLSSQPLFACIHGAIVEAIQTGNLDGGTRVEKLVVRPLSRDTRQIVKLVVGPKGSAVKAFELRAEALDQHKKLAASANAILGEEQQLTFRGSRSIGAPAPKAVSEYTTKGGIVVKVESVDGMDWTSIASHYFIPESADDRSYAVWVKRVKKAGRGLYAVVVDLTDARNRPDFSQQGAQELIALAINVPYAGSNLSDQIAHDKYLEYAGTYRAGVMFGSGIDNQALKQSFEKAIVADGDRFLGAKDRQGGGIDLYIDDHGSARLAITLRDGNIFFKNNSFRPEEASASQPAPPPGRINLDRNLGNNLTVPPDLGGNPH